LKHEFNNIAVPHTPEARLDAARDVDILNSDGKRKPIVKREKILEPPLFASDGRVMQRNQGKWDFKFIDTSDAIILDVTISKFLDTSLIDVVCS
jgi:protein TilB